MTAGVHRGAVIACVAALLAACGPSLSQAEVQDLRARLDAAMEEDVPNREIVHFDASHWLHHDEAEEVNRRLVEFFAA